MNCKKEDLLLYAVTDRSWLRGETLYSQVEKALQGGVTLVQLREKNMTQEEFLQEAKEIRELCRQYQVPLLINDNVEIASAIDADGVHVGQNDMEVKEARAKLGPDKIIGVTAKTIEQAQLAEQNGADYLGVGAVFYTTSKADAREITHETLKEICSAVQIPVVAIGGITSENVTQLTGSGIDGIAVISAIFAQDDIRSAAKALKEQTARVVHPSKAPAASGPKAVLTIAGSDSSGGAGIQADLKTMLANGVYGMSAITALTAQNTTGVTAIMEVTPEFLKEELDNIFTDIYPDAVKIGMVSSAALIRTIACSLKDYRPSNIVVDPVMVATSGARLIAEDAIAALKEELLPLASVVTPNIPEAEVLSGIAITSNEEMIQAARIISETYHCAVLCKGGHKINDANDLLYKDGQAQWFCGKRIDNPNTHGTGCTLSSAIASNLAKGFSMKASVKRAKDYISGALGAMLDLGKGSGPMDHGFCLTGEFARSAPENE